MLQAHQPSQRQHAALAAPIEKQQLVLQQHTQCTHIPTHVHKSALHEPVLQQRATARKAGSKRHAPSTAPARQSNAPQQRLPLQQRAAECVEASKHSNGCPYGTGMTSTTPGLSLGSQSCSRGPW